MHPQTQVKVYPPTDRDAYATRTCIHTYVHIAPHVFLFSAKISIGEADVLGLDAHKFTGLESLRPRSFVTAKSEDSKAEKHTRAKPSGFLNIQIDVESVRKLTGMLDI